MATIKQLEKRKKEERRRAGGGVSDLEATSHDIILSDKTNTPPSPSSLKSSSREIYSSKQHLMEYVTTEGIIQRTGHTDKKDWYLLMFKELQDNSIDFEHAKYPFSSNATVDVDITFDDKTELLHYRVSNTNPDNIPVFENLSDILDFHKTFGSKQNKNIISRGQLGDALKQVKAFSYAMMREQYDKSADSTASFGAAQWTKPMIIRANGKEHRITIKVDDINSDIKTNIDTIVLQPGTAEYTTDTVIENTCPLLKEVRHSMRLGWEEFVQYWKQYMLFTTDITFRIHIADIGRKTVSMSVPALHSISPKWKNKSSIFWYTPKQFRNTIVGVHFKEDTTIYELLQDRFAEAALLKKTPDLDMTISEFLEQTGGDEEILQRELESLYHRLREVEVTTRKGEVKRVEPPVRLSLPYDHISSKERKIHLAERMVNYVSADDKKKKDYLDPSRAVYKIIEGQVITYAGKYEIHYPFAFEIIAVPIHKDVLLEDVNISSRFFGAVNYSISPKGNRFNGNYQWVKKEKDGYEHEVSLYNESIDNVFEVFGLPFEGDRNSYTKVPCYIAANLISPIVAYQGKDKSAVDVAPFAAKIIEAVAAVAKDIPTFMGVGITLVRDRKKDSSSMGKKTSKFSEEKIPSSHEIINEVIGDDCKAVAAAKAVGRRIRIGRERTQNSIWYNGLPRWKYHGVTVDELPGRKGYIKEIPNVTADYDLKREEVGIVASPWAQMYYQGRWWAVTFQDIEELSKKGVVTVFIEKQDIVAALGPRADIVGSALINTRGHLVEYVKELARLAVREEGEDGGYLGWKKVKPATEDTARGKIGIVVDYDSHGLLIASKLKGAIFLGVDERMLRHFGISHNSEGVVDYQPKKKLKQETIDKILADERFSDPNVIDINFLKHNKVEIDAILAHLGDHAAPLWDYIQSLLEEECPINNYNRAIKKRPDSLQKHYPEYIRKFLAYVDKLEDEATEEEAEKIGEELGYTDGFVKVKDKEEEIDNRHGQKIKEYTKFNELATALEKFDRDNGFGIGGTEIPPDDGDGGDGDDDGQGGEGGGGVSDSNDRNHDISSTENNTPSSSSPALLDVAKAAPPEWWNSDDQEVPEPPIIDKDMRMAEKNDMSPKYYVKCNLIQKGGASGELVKRLHESQVQDDEIVIDEFYKEFMLRQRQKLKENKNKPLVPAPPEIPDPPITKNDMEVHRALCQSYYDEYGTAKDCFWQPMICAKDRVVGEHSPKEYDKLHDFWMHNCWYNYGFDQYKRLLEEAYEKVIRQYKEQHNQQLPWQEEEKQKEGEDQ